MNPDSSPFSNEVRVRSCGLLVDSANVLLAQIHSPVSGELVWIPPGGGIEFGESLETGLVREFKEETDLEVETGPLIHINELISPPFHAIEFYFEVTLNKGEPNIGMDPELSADNQLLKKLKWHKISDLQNLDFAPQSLLEKLQNWENRFSFDVF